MPETKTRKSARTGTEVAQSHLAEYVKERLSGGAAPPELPTHRATRAAMCASPGELHVDDEGWHLEQPSGEGAPGRA